MKREKRERTHLTKISDGQAANLPPSSSYLNDYRYSRDHGPREGAMLNFYDAHCRPRLGRATRVVYVFVLLLVC